MSATKDTGIRVQVRLDADGMPLCEHCDDRMVEVEPGGWQCPRYVEADRKLKAALVEIGTARLARLSRASGFLEGDT